MFVNRINALRYGNSYGRRSVAVLFVFILFYSRLGFGSEVNPSANSKYFSPCEFSPLADAGLNNDTEQEILKLNRLSDSGNFSQYQARCETLVQTSHDPIILGYAMMGVHNAKMLPRLKEFLFHNSVFVREHAMLQMFYLGGYGAFEMSERTRHALEGLARRNSLACDLLTLQFVDARFHPLYRTILEQDGVEGVNRFFDKGVSVAPKEFKKTGSRLFLLNGALAGHVVAHIVPKRAAVAWRAALSADWKSVGFDYVPIEPISTLDDIAREYELSRSSIAALNALQSKIEPNEELVFSKIIMGPTITDLSNHTTRMDLGIHDDSIEAALNKFNIVHGHGPLGNTVLQRDGNQIRRYLIDWDQAISTP